LTVLRWAKLASLPVAGLIAAGCGSGRPSDETIYHDPSLRPGVVEATTDAERELLARLGSVDGEQTIELDGSAFSAGPTYAAASGRRCRRVIPTLGGRERLACEADGAWTFVPFVIGAVP
jgi:hypothetical protein